MGLTICYTLGKIKENMKTQPWKPSKHELSSMIDSFHHTTLQYSIFTQRFEALL